jgi:hypothetical protein
VIVKAINWTLGLGLFVFLATATIIPPNQPNANETFQRVAAEWTADAAAPVDEEDYSDGCLIDYSEYGEYLPSSDRED